MEKIKTLLVADRGEIAVRITRTAKGFGIKVIAIYSKDDSTSDHITTADSAILLKGHGAKAYHDGDAIIAIAKEHNADAIIPGYGILSENASFAKKVIDAGIKWVGPSPEAIQVFNIRHMARELAEKSGLPIIPGTKDLVNDDIAAVEAADKLGYPVVVKATEASGLVDCFSAKDVRKAFDACNLLAERESRNPGVFLEKCYPSSRHVEIQIFGNGKGKAIHFGERECSIQRSHRKIIEECPSPFVSRYAGLRNALGEAAVNLAQRVSYGSVGTVEYLIDDTTGTACFLGMKTRLQAEHGITELCYGVDLVGLMLMQADFELQGKGGVDPDFLDYLQKAHAVPQGFAIEARVLAENPVRDFAPSHGILGDVHWAIIPNARVDTWVSTGSNMSFTGDSLLAKVMYHDPDSRAGAIKGIAGVLDNSRICGPPTNLDFLIAILQTAMFIEGRTLTNVVDSFEFKPMAIDVISPGKGTSIQDYPAKPAALQLADASLIDPVAFQIANILVGNEPGKEGLEINLFHGPELHFTGSATVALCGASIEATLDDKEFPMWTQVRIQAGQRLKIGKFTGHGCRCYLAVFGGFPSVAQYMGTKATSPLAQGGGYQGGILRQDDLLTLVRDLNDDKTFGRTLPERLRPTYSNECEILAMVGPHDGGYAASEDIETMFSTEYQVMKYLHHGDLELRGPISRNGQMNGAHRLPTSTVAMPWKVPSIIRFWKGEEPSGKISQVGGHSIAITTVHAEQSKLAQLHVGHTLRYKRVSFEDALDARRMVDSFIESIAQGMRSGDFDNIQPLATLTSANSRHYDSSIIGQVSATNTRPSVQYRQAADGHIIVQYGEGSNVLSNRWRVNTIKRALDDESIDGVISIKTAGNALVLAFDPLRLARADLLADLENRNINFDALSRKKQPIRRFHLPVTFQTPETPESTQLIQDACLRSFVVSPRAGNSIGFISQHSPSEQQIAGEWTFQPNSNGLLSSCSFWRVPAQGPPIKTRTLPVFDAYGRKPGYSPGPPRSETDEDDMEEADFELRPWLVGDFDLLRFRQVDGTEMERLQQRYDAGLYEFQIEKLEVDGDEYEALIAKLDVQAKADDERLAEHEENGEEQSMADV